MRWTTGEIGGEGMKREDPALQLRAAQTNSRHTGYDDGDDACGQEGRRW